MSHQVRIDYNGISLECQSICEVASSQLCKMDSMLKQFEESASRIFNEQAKSLKNEILDMKSKLQKQIDRVVAAAEEKAKLGRVYVDSDFMGEHRYAYDIVYEANNLKNMTNSMVSERLYEMQGLLNSILNDRMKENYKELYDNAFGIVSEDSRFMKELATVEDEILKQYIYIAWIDDRNLPFSELVTKAKNTMNSATEEYADKCKNDEINAIKKEMKENGIDEATINKTIISDKGNAKEQLREIREKATNEIIEEKTRKNTVKRIVKVLKSIGFIIPKTGIRLEKDKNEVVIVAKKPNNETAEFYIPLKRSMTYKFHGYEGQACQKDIEKVMKDLYKDIDVTNKEEIWKNPDKISTMKYQTQRSDKMGG